MMIYLIKSGLCLAIILGSYHLLLEKEKMHRFNRYFLLFGLGFAFVVPLITVGFAIDVFGSSLPLSGSEIIIYTEATPLQSVEPPEYGFIDFIKLLYLIIAGIFFVRCCYKITTLFRKAFLNEKISYHKAKLVLLKEKILPHTFWNYIFINESAYKQEQIEPELFTHELTHAEQRHSFDILVIEVLQVLFWFNPFLIPYKRAIQLNHEFLADDQVVRSHQQVREYQHLLLEKAALGQVSLASNLNFLVTKKRLTMMTKENSNSRAYFFASITIPLFACLLMLFGCNANAQEVPIGNSKMDVQEIKDLYFKDATIVRETKDGQKTYQRYADLTPAEKKELPPPPPSPDEISVLPKGTLVYFSDDGNVLVEKKKGIAPPAPPKPPKAPKAKKAPKTPKAPKAMKAPKVQKAPKAMKAPKEPKAPKMKLAPPPVPSVHIRQLAEEGATFIKDGKKLSAKEAIKFAEKMDPGYLIEVIKGNGSGAKVYFRKDKEKAY